MLCIKVSVYCVAYLKFRLLAIERIVSIRHPDHKIEDY